MSKEDGPFLVMPMKGTRGNKHKLTYQKFYSNIREHLLVKVVENMLFRGVMDQAWRDSKPN